MDVYQDVVLTTIRNIKIAFKNIIIHLEINLFKIKQNK